MFIVLGTPPAFVLGWALIDPQADLITVTAPNGRSETTQIGGGYAPALAKQLLSESLTRSPRGRTG
ncbi:MAG: hypothetical protein JNJ71_10880 [Rubrivivax sp.]|nr:hypothetical protein [Rubrivivax sp.]